MAQEWLSPQEAAARLGVKPATLYAYVSRGQLRRRRTSDGRRSEYHADDLATLAVRGRRARPTRPSDIVLPTTITTITPQGPAYRGRLAVELAGTATFEEVAAHLWQVPVGPAWTADPASLRVALGAAEALPDDAEPARRLLVVTSAARAADPLVHDLRPEVVAATARRSIATMVAATAGGGGSRPSIAASLAASVSGRDEPGVCAAVDAALVLLADHELAASTLAVRIAASARCDPYAAQIAGLAVLSGRRHGSASRPLELVLRDVAAGTPPASALASRTPPGEQTPGHGHPLYPDGDPRAARLLELLRSGPLASEVAPLHEVLAVTAERGLPPANIDAVLAGLTYAIGAPPGTGELLFAVARTAGWTAHAIEQYADPQLLRPTAVYTGP